MPGQTLAIVQTGVGLVGLVMLTLVWRRLGAILAEKGTVVVGPQQVETEASLLRGKQIGFLLESSRQAEDKLDTLIETQNAVHVLVNNAMAVQLRLHAETAMRLALLTGLPEDIVFAQTARDLADEHDARQGIPP